MKLDVNPNRMVLLRLKRRLQTAKRGHKLLKDKQDALIQKFVSLVLQARDKRPKLISELQEIYGDFQRARGVISDKFLEAAILGASSGVNIDIKHENVMGVEVPRLFLEGKVNPYSYGFTTTSGELDVALGKLKKLLPKLLALGELENEITKISQEIEKTKRRVNALEYVLIPNLKETIKFISMKLDENARSAASALMRIKDMLREEEQY